VNQRSQSLDDEIAVLADDRVLAAQLLADFEGDRRYCRRIELRTWQRRGMRQRLLEQVASMLQAHLRTGCIEGTPVSRRSSGKADPMQRDRPDQDCIRR
jgi:hypothetical protein